MRDIKQNLNTIYRRICFSENPFQVYLNVFFQSTLNNEHNQNSITKTIMVWTRSYQIFPLQQIK